MLIKSVVQKAIFFSIFITHATFCFAQQNAPATQEIEEKALQEKIKKLVEDTLKYGFNAKSILENDVIAVFDTKTLAIFIDQLLVFMRELIHEKEEMKQKLENLTRQVQGLRSTLTSQNKKREENELNQKAKDLIAGKGWTL